MPHSNATVSGLLGDAIYKMPHEQTSAQVGDGGRAQNCSAWDRGLKFQRSLFSSQILMIATVGDPFRIFPLLITENVSENVSQGMHRSH